MDDTAQIFAEATPFQEWRLKGVPAAELSEGIYNVSSLSMELGIREMYKWLPLLPQLAEIAGKQREAVSAVAQMQEGCYLQG